MPRRRYISTEMSIDKRLNTVALAHGDFAALLYTWMIPHAEDTAILNGDIDEFMATVIPMRRDKTPEEVSAALEALCDAGLIAWDGQGIYFPVASFYKYQTYISADKRRVADYAVGERKSPENAEERRETPKNAEGKDETPDLDSTPQNAAKRRGTAENAVSVSLSPSPSPSVSPSLSGAAVAAETPVPPPKKTIITEEWLMDERELFRERLPASGFWSFDQVVETRMNGTYFRGCADKRKYIHGQLENAAERWAAERQTNGRNHHHPERDTSEVAGLAAFDGT